MVTRVSQLATCAKYEDNEETTNSVLEDMVTKRSFGHNAAFLLDFTGLILGYNRGYFFSAFFSKMLDCRERTHSTLKLFPWDPIMHDQNFNGTRRRTIMSCNIMSSLLLKNDTLRSSRTNGVNTKWTIGACKNVMGSACVLMLAECHNNS